MVESSTEIKGANDAGRIKFASIFDQADVTARKTKIVCTLGPACSDTDTLVKMLDAGMDIARLNFSHGDHESHGAALDKLRDAMKMRPDKVCATMMDTQGPEIRTGNVRDGRVNLVKD